MASLIRLGAIQVLKKNFVQSAQKNTKISLAPSFVRLLNTSAKQPTQATTTTTSIAQTTPEKHPDDEKEWISWGFEDDDEFMDRFQVHHTLFITISLTFVLGGTIVAYFPDVKQVDWTNREAYLQLRYREDHNLPIIDPDLIELSKIKLPSDEELGDTEIII